MWRNPRWSDVIGRNVIGGLWVAEMEIAESVGHVCKASPVARVTDVVVVAAD